MRSRIAATVAGAALALVGGTAAAAPEVQVDTPRDVMTLDGGTWVMDHELTDHALYTTTWVTMPDGTGAARIWQRDLLPTATGVAVGNARLVGLAAITDWDGGIAADGDGIVFARATGSRELVRHADDGTETRLSTIGAQPVESVTTGWYTSLDSLWPVPADRAGATGGILTGRADDHDTLPWPALQTTSQTTASAVSSTVVVWEEELLESGGDGLVHRVYANALDGSGFVGDPVLLAEGSYGAGALPIGQVTASDDVVAWASIDDHGQAAVSWVPATDLTAAPTVVPDAYLPDLDGTRLSYARWAGEEQPSVGSAILDTATGREVASFTGDDVWLAEAHGDLAVVGLDGGNDARPFALHSISGDTDVASVPQFDDVALNPFATAIDRIALAGITTGYPDGTFRGLALVNRDAMAAFLYRVAGSPAFTPPATSPFTDVSTGHPFYREIAWLADQGISTGWQMADGTREYRPAVPVSRGAMAAFLYRAAEPVFTAPATSPFTDVSTEHPFYRDVAWLADAGISTGWVQGGSAEFRPTASITRQAMAAFLDRFDRLSVG